MKRTVSILLVVFLLMSSFGCQTVSATPPPRSLRFDSLAALKTLLNAAELSDSDFAEFIEQIHGANSDQMDIPRNTTKQEVTDLAQIIETVGIPILKDHTTPDSFYFTYRPDNSWIDIIYRVDDMRYRFCISPTEHIFEQIWSYLSRIFQFPVATWKLDDDTIAFYRNPKVDQRYGTLYRNGYTVSIDLLSYTEKTVSGFPFVTSAEFVWSNTLGESFADLTSPADTVYSGVPRILRFDSVQACRDLVAAVDLEETALQAFLQSNHYAANGIQTREDLLRLKNMLSPVQFPSFQSNRLTDFRVYTDYHSIFLRYSVDSEKTFQFRIYMDAITQKETFATVMFNHNHLPSALSADDYTFRLLSSKDTENARLSSYLGDVEGYCIKFEVIDASYEDPDQHLQTIRFNPLG